MMRVRAVYQESHCSGRMVEFQDCFICSLIVNNVAIHRTMFRKRSVNPQSAYARADQWLRNGVSAKNFNLKGVK